MTGCVSASCVFSEEAAPVVGPPSGTDIYENLELEGFQCLIPTEEPMPRLILCGGLWECHLEPISISLGRSRCDVFMLA